MDNPVLFKDPLELWDDYANFEQTDNEIYRRFLVDYWETLYYINSIHPETRELLELNILPEVFKIISPDHGLITFIPKQNKAIVSSLQSIDRKSRSNLGTGKPISTFIREQMTPKSLIDGMEIRKTSEIVSGAELLTWRLSGFPDHWLFNLRDRFPNALSIVSWLKRKKLISNDLESFGLYKSELSTICLGFRSKMSAKMFLVRLTYFLNEVDKNLF